MPLMLAPKNQSVKIVKIVADEQTKKHLQNLGILVGAEITVFSASRSEEHTSELQSQR